MSDMEILFHAKVNEARVFVFGRTDRFSIENIRFRLFLELYKKDFVDRYRVLL